MARKPTRIWHPARRALSRAQETARSLVRQRNDAARLDDVRTRLQHYLRAMYGQPITIETLAPTKKEGLATRALSKLASARNRSASESNSDSIRLPATLPRKGIAVSPLEQYRVIAVQHAERIRRSSARHARDAATDLEHDLFQLAEAAAIDAQITANQPGLRATLEAARADAIAQRRTPRRGKGIERRVEEIFRRTWSGHQDDAIESADLPAPLPANDAESNAEWARRTAKALEKKFGADAAREYRRMPEMTLWDTTITTQLPEDQPLPIATPAQQSTSDSTPAAPTQKTRTRSAIAGPTQPGSPQDRRGGPSQQPGGNDSSAQTLTTGEAAPGKEPDDSDGTPDASESSVDATQAEGTAGPESEAGTERTTTPPATEPTPAKEVTFRYPEWNVYAQAFTASGTIVRVIPPPLESSEWATHALHEHVREVHQAKRQFELLRSHRVRSRRQAQGDELDLEACVEAMVDRAMHVAPTDRLYSVVRPGRRELAITLLLDVSGSTREVVVGEQRVIDIERIATLVATAAFDALGDDYSILAFSSEGATNVRVYPLKTFDESNSSVVLQRIGALAPHGTTRLGAAVRHATTLLSGHPAPHQLLLIISDGKPHDFGYDAEYAIQDSRHAVMNARLHGIHPFCITIDASQGETYLAEIFGSTGYRVVSRPSQLSKALLVAVQRLVGGTS